MTASTRLWRTLSLATVTLTAAGCAFGGVTTLPLPGTPGRGPGATIYHVQIGNVGTLESNAPVLVNDVVVGSVSTMTVDNWHADVDVTITPGVVVPANAVATVGQTSLLGSMHLALDPPAGQTPTGRLEPGSTITLNRASTYPSTEQTLSALSLLINSGGVTQIGDIIHNTTAALHGHENQIRDLLTRLDSFIGALDRQRDNITAAIDNLDRLTGTLAGQTDTITTALRDIPPALDVLDRERPRLTEALTKLGTFSDVTTRLINDSHSDLVTNLHNLQPTLKALADVGPKLDAALALAPTFPFPQNVIDRGVRGDYLNLYAVVDLTYSRLKRTIFRGTRFGDINADLIPAPGDPYYLQYTYDPLHAPLTKTLPPGTPSAGQAPPPAAPPAQPAGGR
ncbi:virulence factor Mce family protein [Mycolicibacterium chubuense NBB4]|uniref:Virulence factor Mce family protein n=1 Tax=Mycolicibacterium chubuense (strain NBB4) TaxID=710421 RepID=I4BG32_MYCCN|nr:MCE family protein [Mycolicibacterium chubuense]AFM16239.1 virulence factor Mce family protein [Mycolicibacterium chubuense NBB4]